MERKLIIFDNVTLDGYFSGPNGEFDWAHEGSDDPEFADFVNQNASGESQLLFGRKTYKLMAGYWPSAMASRDNPTVATGMNEKSKVVFSNTLNQAEWNNTTLIKGDMVRAVRKLKNEPGPDLVVLGSGSIIAQLSAEGLIDVYQIMVNPLALGGGRTLFEGLRQPLHLELKTTRTFKNGKTYLCFTNTVVTQDFRFWC